MSEDRPEGDGWTAEMGEWVKISAARRMGCRSDGGGGGLGSPSDGC